MSDNADKAAPAGADGTRSEAAQRLQERRQYAIRDLEELSEQVAAGELDAATADRLRAGYQAELEAIDQGRPESQPGAPSEGRSSGRALVGAFLLIGAFTVVILLAAQTFRSDGDSGQPAGSDVATIDGATVEEMEEIVASHPDSPAMRLALADLYFEQGDYSAAIDHYLFVASSEVSPAEESRALGRIGWMAYVTGQSEAAVQYLTVSLEVDPGHLEGKFFLGMVRLYGIDDPAGAIPLLEEVQAFPGLPAEVRIDVEGALDEARAAMESP